MVPLMDPGVQDTDGDAGADGRAVQLPYVLVADASIERSALCLEAIKPFKVGALVARDGEEASRLIERFGPPILLIVDLSLSRKDGFTLIETVRNAKRMRTEIVAWAAFREVREFAASRLAGLNVHILGATSSQHVVRRAIARAMERYAAATTAEASGLGPVDKPEQLERVVRQLAENAARLCRTPGVAIYVRMPGETQFRASVTWTSDTPVPHSPYYIPEVFGRILETGQAVVLPDLSTQPLSNIPTTTLEDVVRGIVAVPILDDADQVIGTICVFDLKPLVIGDAEVKALTALGRAAFGRRTVEAGVSAPASAPASDAEAAAHESAARRSAGEAISSVSWPTAMLEHASAEFAVARELARARREKRPVSIVMFGVSPGAELEGDAAAQLLPTVAETLVKAIRESDLPLRWTEDELVLVLPGLNAAEARAVAERVRAALHAGARYRAAVSAGVVEAHLDDGVGAIIMRLKDKVREAFERGHNRVA